MSAIGGFPQIVEWIKEGGQTLYEYDLITGDQGAIKYLLRAINSRARDGWRLVGPVQPDNSGRLLATLSRPIISTPLADEGQTLDDRRNQEEGEDSIAWKGRGY